MKTVSYELALRLKEVAERHGVVLPKSHFFLEIDEDPEYLISHEDKWDGHEYVKAHTADELMDGMPPSIENENRSYCLVLIRTINGYCSGYMCLCGDCSEIDLCYGESMGSLGGTASDSLCNTFIAAIENGYVKGVTNE